MFLLSSTAPVDRDALERGEIHTFEATHVDRRGIRARWALAEGERRASALGAETMSDHMLVELVRGHGLFRRLEMQLAARDEPEEIAFAAAVRTIALLDFRQLAFDFERDATAMTAS
jgi:hypothetical protein